MDVDTMPPATGAKLLEQLRAAYVQKGWRHFYPQQFVAAGLGSEQDVVSVLLALEKVGVVTTTAILRCDTGHLIWSGPLRELQRQMGRRCRECENAATDECDDFVLRFDLAPTWVEQIDQELQKKSP